MTDNELSVDRSYDQIASRRGRYLRYLSTNPIRLSDMASRITEWKHGTPADDRLDKRLAIYTSLYHIHISKLAETDVGAYSQWEEMVELNRNATQLRPYLEQAAEEDLGEVNTSLL